MKKLYGKLLIALALGMLVAAPRSLWSQEPAKAEPAKTEPAAEPAAEAAAAPFAATATQMAAAAGENPLTHDQLLKRVPFDLITTDAKFNNEVFQVKPIDFGGGSRTIPAQPKPSDKLQVWVISRDQKAEIEWHNIDRIDLFEDVVLAEADAVVAAGKLDQAYDYFLYLHQYYPRTKGLSAAHENFLHQCVLDARQRDKPAEALAVAEELYRRNNSYQTPDNATIIDVIGQIADQILDAYVKKDDFNSAKTLLKRLETKYGQTAAFSRAWRQRLADIAARHRDQSRRHLADGRFVEAYDACAEMMKVWPDVEGAPELAAEIAAAYPLVMVGVAQPALAHDARNLADAAARRTGSLVERRLMEFAGLGPEGGDYRCTLGSFSTSDDRLELNFQIAARSNQQSGRTITAFDLTGHLLDLADPASPDHQPQWARILERVEVSGVGRVRATLKTPHVLPQAFLQTSYDQVPNVGAPGVKGSGPYFVLERTAERSRFTKNDRSPLFTAGQPAEVMERFYADSKRGLLALERGEVDVLDQVFPGDVAELAANPELAVGRTSVPTVHFLTIAQRNPFLTNRTFRRALVYGSNREAILADGLLKNADLPGFRVISAPFPAPVTPGDATAYGYDEQIQARPFNPWLALVLKAVAANELKSQFEKTGKPAPKLTPLTLGHPADEISRIACRALSRQWKTIGIDVNLIEFPPGVFIDQKAECDLVYTQGATWEPIVDAGRLFAPGGLTPVDNSYVNLMLRKVESARDWVEARQGLRDLHRQLHEDVSVIPLWQTFDFYAWRRSVQGIQDGQSSLYQTIGQWQVAPRLANN